MKPWRLLSEAVVFVVLFFLVIFGGGAFAQAVEPVAKEAFAFPDLGKAYEFIQLAGILVLLFLGAITILATYVGKAAKLIADFTDSKLDDEKAAKIIAFANRLSKLTLGYLQLFPTLGKNPATKALESKLEELKGVPDATDSNPQI